MKRIKLKSAGMVAPTRTVLQSAGNGPIIRGDTKGDADYLCSGCDFVLMQGIEHGTVRGFYLRCPTCGALSISG